MENHNPFLYRSRSVHTLTLILFFVANTLHAQTHRIDSLQNQLHFVKNDTAYSLLLLSIADEFSSIDSSLSAKDYAEHSLQIARQSHFLNGIYRASTSLAGIYLDLGDYSKALENDFVALSIADTTSNKRRQAVTNNAVGIAYWYQGDLNKALEYYKKSLPLQEELHDTSGIARSLNNIGIVSKNLGDTAKALDYYKQALTLATKIKDKRSIANTLNNIGTLYQAEHQNERALNYYLRSLYLREEMNDKVGISTSLTNIGALYFEMGDFTKAEQYELEGLAISRELNDLVGIQDACDVLTSVYEKKKDGLKALQFYREFIKAKDSLRNEEGKHNIERLELKYQFENERLALKKDQENQKALADAEQKKQQLIIIAVTAGLIMVFGFLLFILNRFRIIRSQKKIIEEKNREITDSIYYAKRIQDSHLPTEKFIDRTIKRLKE